MRLNIHITPKKAYIKYIKPLIAFSLLVTLFLFYILPKRRPIKNTNLHLFDVSAFLDITPITAVELNSKIQLCKTGKVEVLVGVPSSPGNQEARDAVRKSWAKYLPQKWTLLFVLGATEDTEIQNAILEESIQHGDIYQATHLQDSYQNLTLKTLTLLDWTHQYCTQVQYILKIDDDVFLNTPKFTEFLECLTKAQNNIYGRYKVKDLVQDGKADIQGVTERTIDAKCDKWNPYEHVYYFIDSKSNKYVSYAFGGYLYSNVAPDRNPYSKWVMPEEVYPSRTLPPFLSGTAYFLSSSLLPHLLYEARHTPLLPLEDVYLTGVIGSSGLNLRLSHVEGWSRFRPWLSDACLYNNLMTAHGLSPKQLVEITNSVMHSTPEYCNTMYYYILSILNDIVSYVLPNYKS